jgi:hypothetical protein
MNTGTASSIDPVVVSSGCFCDPIRLTHTELAAWIDTDNKTAAMPQPALIPNAVLCAKIRARPISPDPQSARQIGQKRVAAPAHAAAQQGGQCQTNDQPQEHVGGHANAAWTATESLPHSFETLDAELPAMLGGVEHHAGRPAEGPCPARGAGIQHPGLSIAIGDQAVAVPIDDGAGTREAAAQTLMAITGGDLMSVYDRQHPAGQLQGLVLAQVMQDVPLR